MRTIKGYSELAKLTVFAFSDVDALTGSEKSAYSMLTSLMNEGLVRRIRKNMYSCVSPATGEVVASRYQIACASSSSSYLSHQTAFEFHGFIHQLSGNMYVGSEARFRNFKFEGFTYKRVAPRVKIGVIEPPNFIDIRVTDLERTVVDSIRDVEKIGGLDELMNCLSAIDYLDQQKLRVYLDAYNIQGLYQRTGYLLELHMKHMGLSQGFIDYCKNQTGKSTRYLLNEAMSGGVYNSKWRLIIPHGLFQSTFQLGSKPA